VQADTPEDSYLQFSIFDVLPDSVTGVLSYFVDDGVGEDGEPVSGEDRYFEIRIPTIDFGDVTPASIAKYTPYAQAAFKLAEPILKRYGIELPISTLDLSAEAGADDESDAEAADDAATDPGTDAAAETGTDPAADGGSDAESGTPADAGGEDGSTTDEGTDAADDPAPQADDSGRVWADATQVGSGDEGRSEVQILDLSRVIVPTPQGPGVDTADWVVVTDIADGAIEGTPGYAITFKAAFVTQEFRIWVDGEPMADGEIGLFAGRDDSRTVRELQGAYARLLSGHPALGWTVAPQDIIVERDTGFRGEGVRFFVGFGGALAGKTVPAVRFAFHLGSA
jgi:hypothetical protein